MSVDDLTRKFDWSNALELVADAGQGPLDLRHSGGMAG